MGFVHVFLCFSVFFYGFPRQFLNLFVFWDGFAELNRDSHLAYSHGHLNHLCNFNMSVDSQKRHKKKASLDPFLHVYTYPRFSECIYIKSVQIVFPSLVEHFSCSIL